MDEISDDPNNRQNEEEPSSELTRKFEAELRSGGLPPAQIEKVVQTFNRITIEKTHRGPLPSAESFAAYEAVFPGAAKEILDMAVRQQVHSHACDTTTIRGELSYRNYGMLSAVCVVLSLVVGAVICAVYGQTSVAITLGGTAGIATLAGAFIKGRRLFEAEKISAAPKPGSAKIPPKRKK